MGRAQYICGGRPNWLSVLFGDLYLWLRDAVPKTFLCYIFTYKISIYRNWTYSDIFYLYFLIYMYLEDTTSEMLFTTFWYFRYSFPKKPAKYIKCCFENM